MPVEILMPELGESVHEGTVSKWLKQVGEFVKEDEPIVEIMTDKVNTELPSPASGVLTQILIQEGEPVAVFAPMGIIDEHAQPGTVVEIASKEAKTSSSLRESQLSEEILDQSPVLQNRGERKWYTPVVRAMAKEHCIADAELESISGSGAGGRVNKQDLEQYLVSRNLTSRVQDPTSFSTPPLPLRESSVTTAPVANLDQDQKLVPLTGMRKMIADAMVRSSLVPTVSTVIEVDVTHMVKFREVNKDSFQQQFGVKLTYTPFFIKSLAEALMEYPLLNAALQPDNKILMNQSIHIGVAVSLGPKGDQGLIVPVIRNCEKQGLVEIAKELELIAKKARNNSLGVTDVQGGTFTLTNPGSYGASLGTPMINAPQAGILGSYAIKKIPAIIDGMIAIRSVMNLVLTYDHRLVDGMLAGKFLQSIKQKLENFNFFK